MTRRSQESEHHRTADQHGIRTLRQRRDGTDLVTHLRATKHSDERLLRMHGFLQLLHFPLQQKTRAARQETSDRIH